MRKEDKSLFLLLRLNADRHRGTFGNAGYQELVEYDQVIGVWYTNEGSKVLTKVGKIHYNSACGYHVIPSRPDLIKLKND